MFEECLYFNATSLARKLERLWSRAFSPFGLTPAQAFMLRVILDKPGSLQNVVAKQMNVTRSTATRTLDGLERLGLVERRDSPQDGREFQIHPTGAAVAIKDGLNRASANVTRMLKQNLGQDVFQRVVGEIRATQNGL
ncbi:MAG: MarR family transcriptional regulator [Hyphomicrobiales bacterium]|jgi:DNA-binding MarR family transcriptional regulator|nr:MarR family transcriptional regulator [Hyphomicrobiales bacterium]